MNSQEIEILVKLKDEVTEGFKKLSTNVKKSGDDLSGSFRLTGASMASLQRVIVGGAAVAGAALAGFLISSAKSAGEAQVAMARVEATLKTMGEAAVKNKEQILKAADAAVRLGFDDEDAAESITKMYQRTGDLTKATQLNNLAMDLARAKNIDLLDATNLVGQVLSGNGRILKQYGIEISDSLPPLQALKELQKQVGGQAEAFSQTFQGQMQVLSVNFQNIKETIGQVLIDALGPFIQQFTGWLNDPKTKESFAKWTADFKSWADVIIPVVIDVFKLWFNVIEAIYNKIIEVGQGITDLISKVKSFYESVKNFSVTGSSQTLSQKLFGRASGGSVSMGTPYMVGERGQELFVPSTSGSIIPNGRSGAGAMAITVNINGGYYLSENVAEDIGDLIISRLKMSNAL